MARSLFPHKAFTTAALLFFLYKIIDYTADALDFVWSVKIATHEAFDFEDLDTEEFRLPEKCPALPPYESPPPPYENNN